MHPRILTYEEAARRVREAEEVPEPEEVRAIFGVLFGRWPTEEDRFLGVWALCQEEARA